MRYECDCGASYSNLDALYACQSSNHGQPTYIRDEMMLVLQAEVARLRLAIEGDRDVWDIVDIKNAEIERLRADVEREHLLNRPLVSEIARLRAAIEVALQLETAFSEYLSDPQWLPQRGHVERAHRDVARMTAALQPKEGEKSFENECYAWDRPVIGRKLDKALAEIARLRAALEEMIEISQRNSDATLMLIAIRKCAQHALQSKAVWERSADGTETIRAKPKEGER